MPDRFLTAVLLFAFGLRAITVCLLADRAPAPDAVRDYLPIADNLLAGQGFINAAGDPDSRRGPGFPILVAAATLLFPDNATVAVVWMHVVIDTATVWVVAVLCTSVLGSAAGVWSALLYAINPLSVYACGVISPEILFAFLVAVLLTCLQFGSETGQRRWFVWAGIAIGGAVLTRATPVLLVPILAAWLTWSRRSNRTRPDRIVGGQRSAQRSEAVRLSPRRGFMEALVFGLSAAAVVLPWTIRNGIVFREFIPVVANGGLNFHAGSSELYWSPPHESTGQMEKRIQELTARGDVMQSPEQWSGPGARDRHFFDLGRANYRLAWSENPAALISYLARKSLRLLYATHSGQQQLFVGAVNVLWLMLAIGGCIVSARSGNLRPLMPCVITTLYFPLVMTAFFPLARYVVGFIPALCIPGAAACLAAQQVLTQVIREEVRRGTGAAPSCMVP